MGVTVLPDWGPQLAQAFANIGQGASKVVNPLQDIQMALKSALIQNPEIGAKLRELERHAPGTIQRLYGLGSDSNTFAAIMGMQPTSAIMKENLNRGALSTPATPAEQGEIRSQFLTGMSRGQAATSGATADVVNANPQLAGEMQAFGAPKAEVDVKAQATQMKGQRLLLAQRWLASQTLDAQSKTAAFAEIPSLLDEHQFHERLKSEEEMFNARTLKDLSVAATKNENDEADQWVRITGVGNQAKWKQYLFGDMNKRDTLPEIDAAFHSVGTDKLAAKNIRLNNSISAGIKALTAKDKDGYMIIKEPSQRALEIKKLEQLINQKSMLGGPKVRVVDETKKNFLGFDTSTQELKFVDKESNQELSPDQLTQDYALPGEFSPQAQAERKTAGLSPKAKSALDRLNSAKDREGSIKNMQKEAPALYAELKAAGVL